MWKQLVSTAIVTASLFNGLVARADLVFSNLELTSNSISFDVSGTMPSTGPAALPQYLFFTNPNVMASPGYVSNSFILTSSDTRAFSGAQTLTFAATGNPGLGDYSFAQFASDLSTNESLDGSLTATWSSNVFEPSAVSSLDVYWGTNSAGSSVTGGVFLGNIAAIPEPTAFLYGGLISALASCGYCMQRRSATA